MRPRKTRGATAVRGARCRAKGGEADQGAARAAQRAPHTPFIRREAAGAKDGGNVINRYRSIVKNINQPIKKIFMVVVRHQAPIIGAQEATGSPQAGECDRREHPYTSERSERVNFVNC